MIIKKMLGPIKNTLDFKRIILASSSPQRKDILLHVGLRFEVIPSLFDENLDPKSFPSHAEYAVETAYQKVLEVANRTSSDPVKPDIIIGADTVVSLDEKLYGKPKSTQEAKQFLKELSGREHLVHTGVVIKANNATVKFHETCKVLMTCLNDEIITDYIQTKEPMNKAGAYGIQGIGGSLIERIDGDYFTVMGLPLHSLCKHLVRLMDDRVEMRHSAGTEASNNHQSEKDNQENNQ